MLSAEDAVKSGCETSWFFFFMFFFFFFQPTASFFVPHVIGITKSIRCGLMVDFWLPQTLRLRFFELLGRRKLRATQIETALILTLSAWVFWLGWGTLRRFSCCYALTVLCLDVGVLQLPHRPKSRKSKAPTNAFFGKLNRIGAQR